MGAQELYVYREGRRWAGQSLAVPAALIDKEIEPIHEVAEIALILTCGA